MFWFGFGLRLCFPNDFLLCDNNLSRTLEFFDRQCSVFVVVVIDSFLQQVFGVLNTCFFGDFLHDFHVNFLRDFNGGLHRFHGDRDSTVLATFL